MNDFKPNKMGGRCYRPHFLRPGIKKNLAINNLKKRLTFHHHQQIKTGAKNGRTI